ncbi:MAG: NADH-quinone oxidoreductase subunit C, partial [Armatimonadetes bacterium]|nr:NADH-quinone oxidoreductase subunit C [Armatimonadota bacterium]
MREELILDLLNHFPDVLEDLQENVKGQFVASLPREALPPVAKHIVKQLGARFVINVGTDMREKTGDFRVSYVFSFDEEQKFLVLQSAVPANDLTISSITPEIPAANWSERETYDLIGIVPVGHPDPRRLILPDDFPKNAHPLRREFEYNQRFPSQPENAPPKKPAPAGTTVIPIG